MFTKLLLSLLSLIIALDRIVAGNDAHTFVLAPQRATIGRGQRAAQATHGGTIATTATRCGNIVAVAIAALSAAGQRIVALLNFDFDIEHVEEEEEEEEE